VDAESVRIAEAGTLTMPDDVWDRTKLISAAIAPLAAQSVVGRVAVDAVAASLGISRRQVYVLPRHFRAACSVGARSISERRSRVGFTACSERGARSTPHCAS
jgi:hypothetical protein